MGVAEDIVAWLDGQKPWISDAARRIASQGALGEGDIADLTEMVKHAHGIVISSTAPVLLALADIPQDEDVDGARVCLVRITNAVHVNALDMSQTLEFAPIGLTAIYGDNGSGKSSYARLLRQLCHSRGARGPILANVYQQADAGKAPTASVAYSEDGADRRFEWNGRDPAPSAMGQVAVFDSNAAHALVEQDNEVLWKPRGLDLLDRVVPAVIAVKKRLEDEAQAIQAARTFPHIMTDTPAGRFVGALETADEVAVDGWAFNQEHARELENLERACRATDIGPELRRLKTLAGRVGTLATRMERLVSMFGTTATLDLAAERERVRTLRAAADGAARRAFGDEGVHGVGGDAWQALWAAAQRFAAAGANEQGVFPSQDEGEKCLLCLQDLGTAALVRLDRFREFVAADVAAQSQDASAALAARERDLGGQRVSEASDQDLLTEIEAEDAALSASLRAFLLRAEEARRAISQGSPEEAGPSLSPELKAFAATLEARASVLTSAAEVEQRPVIERQARELRAHAALWEARDAVREEIRRAKRHAALTRAAKDAVTTGISRKSTELTDKYMTDALLAAYGEEVRALRIGDAVELKPIGTAKGKSQQRVALRVAEWALREKSLPGTVLSEGERRAVALATFFTELRMRKGKSAVVLDDPVSSLDHERQDDVARRLVAEALRRQVVVFTHNLVFLRFLEDIAKEQRVALRVVEVAREGGRPGVCTPEAPWKAKKFSGQISWLNAHRDALQKQAKTQPELTAGSLAFGYGRLRQAAERALEERLLGACVERYARGVHATALWKVRALTDDDVREYLRIYDRATKWGSIHDGTLAENVVPPRIEDFDADIKALSELVAQVGKRQNEREK